MRIKVCQGVNGFLVVTMVTSLMLVYKVIYSDRASMSCPVVASSAHTSPPRTNATVKKQDTSQEKPPVPTLQGYNALVDQKPLKMHCKTCAVVSSSGHLAGSKRGKQIDQSECVIRMNDAPSIGYQSDVGHRTTVRIVAHSSVYRLLKNKQQLLHLSQDTVFIFWGPSHVMKRDGKGHVYNSLRKLKQEMPKLQIYMISQAKMLKFDELFKKETGMDRRKSNTWLSTGWFSMVTALELCDRISVFGMVPPDFCRSPSRHRVPYHYYEPSGPDECSLYLTHEKNNRGSHRFITEKLVFSNWARNVSMSFYQPDWDPSALWNSSSTDGF